MQTLDGRVALVTGGMKGVGRGVARQLADDGAQVFVTGRSASDFERVGARTTVIRCDHRDDAQVDAVFERIRREAGAIDVLVNNVWGGYEGMIENGQFTWTKPFWAAQKHVGNVAYGVSKAATDKLTADMAHELRAYGVAVVSLYPGLVRTEKVMEAAAWIDLSNSESPEFIGRAVSALASDPDVLRHTGRVLVAAQLAAEYGFTDVD